MERHETSELSAEERARILERVRYLANLLDNAIRIPVINYRIGLDPIIGLIPGAGDAVGLGLAAYIIVEAWRLGVRGSTLLRMIVNVLLDFLIGLVPVVGDFFDATFKANQRNLALLINTTAVSTIPPKR